MASHNKAYVLYVDHQGHPAPLTECFIATASRRVSSSINNRYPPSSVTEVDSAFCPQCLSFHDAASASRLGYCPKSSTCSRCPICVVTVLSVRAAENRCFFQCSSCDWTSHECDLTVALEGDELDMAKVNKAAEDLATDLQRRRDTESTTDLDDYVKQNTAAWETHTKPAKPRHLSKSSRDPDWSIEVLESELEQKRSNIYSIYSSAPPPAERHSLSGLSVQRLSLDEDSSDPENADSTNIFLESFQWQALHVPFSTEPYHRRSYLPLPTPLRARTVRRCRAELSEGRPGILLKPKLNPLEGDSSLRTGHGQWWKKDSSAIHVIPRARVVQSRAEEGNLSFLLEVTNPTLSMVRVRMTSSTYKGEKEWHDENSTTSNMHDLLLDTLTQESKNVKLQPIIFETTDTVELSSAEDSIIDLGSKDIETPQSVRDWSGSSSVSLALVGRSTCRAWFGVCVAMEATAEGGMIPGVPLALQVQIGDGSWESSLIMANGAIEEDWVNFDLVLAWV